MREILVIYQDRGILLNKLLHAQAIGLSRRMHKESGSWEASLHYYGGIVNTLFESVG